MPDEFDVNTMPLEELAALANAQPEEPEAEVETPEAEEPQARDAGGRFQSAPDTTTRTQVSRTIDLGDGSGKQVFTADSYEQLADKLAEAQTHATRKIRELNQVAKSVPPAPVKRQRTADEEYMLGQRFVSEPTKAVKDVLESELGMSLDELKAGAAQARQIRQERIDEANAEQWVKKNPDFVPNAENAQRMKAYVNRFLDGGLTQENLDTAFQTLNADGLLKAAPQVAVVPVVKATPAPPRARAGSLSSRISAITPSVDERFPFGDPSQMTLEQLEAAAYKQSRS